MLSLKIKKFYIWRKIKGNIESIHWYNRLKTAKENTKKYGRTMVYYSCWYCAGVNFYDLRSNKI